MPKMFVRSTEGTFPSHVRWGIASALTDLGIDCEKLSERKEVREGVWVLFSEYQTESVFRGGSLAPSPTVVLEVYALEGGLDDRARKHLIAEATEILRTHASLGAGIPVYVVINETPESDWGMFGEQVELADLREP
ncbi:tautomerase family protein [Curtobacterium sp. A7_M15]|jgi:phenylpyruvate tautomerase PptA (4-oxalocrotonate tautomerase family)|uniref:tautomerase family protein n=1 Tax=Curtobacterium sp. A7_M15 TaxID=3065241 RepID=UPI002737915C|nr:tautomerase family protein [Curtobacterium sp. A7_M15]MDP4332742.1 tautomerase family protein [Curtobacterium sp. A7_M15]